MVGLIAKSSVSPLNIFWIINKIGHFEKLSFFASTILNFFFFFFFTLYSMKTSHNLCVKIIMMFTTKNERWNDKKAWV